MSTNANVSISAANQQSSGVPGVYQRLFVLELSKPWNYRTSAAAVTFTFK